MGVTGRDCKEKKDKGKHSGKSESLSLTVVLDLCSGVYSVIL